MADDNLRRALDEVECDLFASEAELTRLQRRVSFLKQSRAGLQGLLGLAAESSDTTPSEDAVADEPTEDAELSIEKSPVARPQSVDAVRTILAEKLDEEVHIDHVRNEIKSRSWGDPSWANPDAAIYAALTRLEKRDDHVERVSRRYWRLRSTPVPDPVELSSETPEDLFDEENVS